MCTLTISGGGPFQRANKCSPFTDFFEHNPKNKRKRVLTLDCLVVVDDYCRSSMWTHSQYWPFFPEQILINRKNTNFGGLQKKNRLQLTFKPPSDL